MRWIAGALVATAAAVAVAAPKQDLDAVRDRLETLQGELRESEQTKANVADQVRASEKAIGEANRRLNNLARQRDDLKRQIQELAARSEQARSQITRQQEEIGRMLRAQYVTGRSEPLRVVLDREDPNRKARDLRYLTYVSRARAEVVTGLRANLTAIAELADATAAKAAGTRVRRARADGAAARARAGEVHPS
jgi:septal ring factor EnvC (AmiA/AmiB activator)